jgi:hypothetical protein
VDENGQAVAPTPEGCYTIPQAPCILDYAGVPIVPSEGCIQLPTSGAPPSFDCGLTTNPAGDLMVDTSGTWPLAPLTGPAFAGPAATAGQVFCETATGALRTAPEHTTVVVAGAQTTLVNAGSVFLNAGDTYSTPTYGSTAITNPSPTRNMRVFIHVQCSMLNAAGPTGGLYANAQRDTGGGFATFGDSISWPYTGVGEPLIFDEKAMNFIYTVSVTASASYSANFRLTLNNTTSTSTAVRATATMLVHMWGWTQ